ncbi:MAG: ABC transporter substrate-binding protein [Syntrophorhabdales bacterium]|jgi:branched-chain amino acid transport system substrate-binding protein
MRTVVTIFFSLLLLAFVGAASAQQTITLGIPTSLNLIEGKEANLAARLAVEEINAKGGVKVGNEKRLFKVESIDIRDGEPGVPVSEALLGIEKLILDKKAYATVVGNFRSEALLAAMDIYSKYKVVNIGTIAMVPKFEELVAAEKAKYKYSYRMCLDSKYLAATIQGLMKYINKDFGYNKVFIATQDVLWAAGTGALMEKWFKENGWTVVGFEKYPTGAQDFSAGLMKARSGGAQVILPIFDMPTSGTLLKQWKSMKIPSLMAGFISPLIGTKAWEAFGEDIDGCMNVVFELGNVPVKAYPPSTKFYEDYKKRYKEEVQSGHGVSGAYDAVYVLANAIEKAGTLDSDKVAQVLETTDAVGSVGRIKFSAGHQLQFGNDPKTAAVAPVFQWRKGKRVEIYPESIADGKIEKPAWMK